jgi:hypothetical protein
MINCYYTAEKVFVFLSVPRGRFCLQSQFLINLSTISSDSGMDTLFFEGAIFANRWLIYYDTEEKLNSAKICFRLWELPVCHPFFVRT